MSKHKRGLLGLGNGMHFTGCWVLLRLVDLQHFDVVLAYIHTRKVISQLTLLPYFCIVTTETNFRVAFCGIFSVCCHINPKTEMQNASAKWNLVSWDSNLDETGNSKK